MIRSFLLSSIILFCSGCSPALFDNIPETTPDNSCVNKFIPEIGKSVYNTQADVLGRHMSGILVIKQLDTAVRTVFTSETGLTFFDFEFTEPGFKVVYCTPKLNRKPVIRTLQKELGLLIRHEMKNEPDFYKSDSLNVYTGFKSGKEIKWYITDRNCTELNRILVSHKNREKIIVNLSMNDASMPDSVYIEHQTFNFTISLNKIN